MKEMLAQIELKENDLWSLLQHTLGPGIDFADIYLQLKQYEVWSLEEGIIKEGAFAMQQGAGIRALSKAQCGFSYVNSFDVATLKEASLAARSIAASGVSGSIATKSRVQGHKLYLPHNPLKSFQEAQKIALLHDIDKVARSYDRRIEQVMATLSGSYETILVLSNDTGLAFDIRPLINLSVRVVAKENGRYETGYAGGGARLDYSFFADGHKYATEAARIAILNLAALPAPAGTMPVVLGHGWPGVLLHEAVGHGLEGDFIRKGSSVFSGKVGTKVAAKTCTVVDNGCYQNQRRGSLNIDDEGVKTQDTVLIKDGILQGYLFDKLNARLLGTKSTGNGRRESFAYVPLPRMTNTYLLPGKYEPEEIIASVTRGIYAVNFSGGQVDITSGNFVFSTSEAYLIEHGKVTAPLKGVTLIGDGATVLQNISLVGNDLALDPGMGTCGKEGQSVPVGVGQPTLKIDALTVGGTS